MRDSLLILNEQELFLARQEEGQTHDLLQIGLQKSRVADVFGVKTSLANT